MANAALSAHLRRDAARPVTDAARDDVTERLDAAFAEGTFDVDTYRRLLALVFDARTLGELVPIAEQLPSVPVSNLPDIVRQQHRPGELAPILTSPGSGRRMAVVAVPAVLAGLGVLVVLGHLLHLF